MSFFKRNVIKRDIAGSNQVLVAIAMVLVGAVLFVIQDTGIKWLTAEMAVLQIIFVRSLFGIVFLYYTARVLGQPIRFAVKRPWLLLFRTAVNVASWCFFFTGLKYLPLATATALFFTFPLFLTALSVPLLKEHVGIRRWLAVLVGFVGVVLITKPGAGMDGELIFPMAMMLVAAFGWALVAVATRKLGEGQDAASILFFTLLGFAGTMWLPQFWIWQPMDMDAWFLIALVAAFGVTAQFLMTKAYTMTNPSITAPFEYSALIWAGIAGYLFWNDVPDVWSVLGTLSIVGSGVFILYREAKRRKEASRT